MNFNSYRMMLACQCALCVAWRHRLGISLATAYKPVHGGYPTAKDNRRFEIDIPWPWHASISPPPLPSVGKR